MPAPLCPPERCARPLAWLPACLLAVACLLHGAPGLRAVGSDEPAPVEGRGSVVLTWDAAREQLQQDPPLCIAPAWAWLLRQRWTSWSQASELQGKLTLGDEPAAPPVEPEPQVPAQPAGEPSEPAAPAAPASPPVAEGGLPVAPGAPVEVVPAPRAPATAAPRAPVQAPAQRVVSSLAQGPVCACPSLGWSYWVGSFDMVPGAGGSLGVGFVQERTHARERALELSYTWQDLWLDFSGEGQGGRFQVLRAGWAWRDDPCCSAGWVWRAGLGLVMISGRPRDMDLATVYFHEAGNYLGGYGGVGYEWRYGAWSHGPEVQLFVGADWDAGEVGVAGSARWTVTYRY